MTASSFRRLVACGQTRFRTIAAVLILAIACSLNSLNACAASPTLDRVYVIVLENHSFDDALFGQTPFAQTYAQTYDDHTGANPEIRSSLSDAAGATRDPWTLTLRTSHAPDVTRWTLTRHRMLASTPSQHLETQTEPIGNQLDSET